MSHCRRVQERMKVERLEKRAMLRWWRDLPTAKELETGQVVLFNVPAEPATIRFRFHRIIMHPRHNPDV